MRLTVRSHAYAALAAMLFVPVLAMLALTSPAWRQLFQAAEPLSRTDEGETRFQELTNRIAEMRRTGHYSDAAPLARERRELCRRLPARRDQFDDACRVANWLDKLASRSKADQAEVSDVLRQLDQSYAVARQRRHEEAAAIRRRAVATLSRNFGEEDDETMYAVDALARTLMDLRQYEEAEAHFRRLLHLRRKRFGEEHERMFDSCQSLAGALEGQCKFREAEQLRRAALSIVAKLEAKSDMHLPAETYGMRTAAVAGRLGFDLNRQGKYAEAEPLLRRAIRLWPMDPWLLDGLAESVLRQERFTEASGLLNQSQKIRQQLKLRKVNAGRRPAG